MKVLLDTNILLDIVEKREPSFAASYEVILKSATKEIDAIIGAGSVTDIYYINRRNCGNDEQALNSIIDLLKVVTLVDTKAADIQEAIKLGFSDFEDAVIAATASREQAGYIITRNVKDFSKSSVPAISPAEFLQQTKAP
ncbi:MAG: PIN domain-containing protein [Treponema sp.]|nr:PIN domain-containing protein [Treponema sp.]